MIRGANGEGRTPKPFRAPDPKSKNGFRQELNRVTGEHFDHDPERSGSPAQQLLRCAGEPFAFMSLRFRRSIRVLSGMRLDIGLLVALTILLAILIMGFRMEP